MNVEKRQRGSRDAFKNLLERYPDLELYINKLVALRCPIQEIRDLILLELKQKGVHEWEYPFCTSRQGYYGLRNHVRRYQRGERVNALKKRGKT